MWLTYRRKSEKRSITNDPLKVRNVQPKANEAECSRRHDEALKLIRDLASENKKDHERIYDQVDEVDQRAQDKLGQSMEKVNETMRKLPAEIIALLRATGQLKDHHD